MREGKEEFVARLNKAFEYDSMAEVARRLDIPHATVRNYYQGRYPAPEMLIKMANTSGVSLNWLLTGKGEMFAGLENPIGLGTLIEDKINKIIDDKLASFGFIRQQKADVPEEEVGAEPVAVAAAEAEPVAASESETESETETETESESEAVAEAEPVVEAVAEAGAEPDAEAEPEAEAEVEPVVDAEPVAEAVADESRPEIAEGGPEAKEGEPEGV